MNMDNYGKELKITLWVFIIGFVFSIILGLIVGNPIVISLLRAFVASILFAFVVFGILYIVKKYIPELADVVGDFRSNLKEEKKEESEEKGTRINYVVGADSKSDEGKENYMKEDKNIENKDSSFKDVLSDIEKKEGTAREKQSKGEISTPEKVSSEESEEDELPPIEELLNEEEDIVPETEIEEENISTSNNKVSGDYIKIGDVKIPNEPEIIAKAIKKVMQENE